MKNTNFKRLDLTRPLLGSSLCLLLQQSVHAHIALSSKWESPYLAGGRTIAHEARETTRVDKAALASVVARTATPYSTAYALDLGFQLFVDQTKYYVQPTKYMPQRHPGDICTPAAGKVTAYQCKEGQRATQACHIGFFNADFKEVGWHTIRINESAPVYCNAVPALGVAKADRNEMLVTVQYFFIDGPHATRPGEIGQNWQRMTVLLRLKAENGNITAEQDDRCLGNPNRIDTVPDAKRALKGC